MRALPSILAISLTALNLLACDKGSPTAPPGAKVFLSVSPLQIGANGTAVVTVTVLRSSGQPVNPGTEVRLDTSLGTLEPLVAGTVPMATVSTESAGATLIVTTDQRGIADALLRGSGQSGTAKVTARSGTAEAATADVKVGVKVDKITLTATPATIPPGEAAHVSLLAVVRDDQGQPIPDANVIFTTNVGRLASQGAIVVTDARGQARDTLDASADAVDTSGGTITVTAQAAGGGGSITATATITVRGNPILPTLSIGDANQNEGNTGTTTLTFTVSLTGPAGAGGVTFDIGTADGTATVAGNDYAAKSLTGQSIASGSSGPYSFSAIVNGDASVEQDETFLVNVTNVAGANPGDTQGRGTIANDDATPTPTLNIADVTQIEGNPPSTATFTFAVTLTAPAGAGGVTFDIATADSTATDADNDYEAQSLTGRSIASGSSGPFNFSVTVNGDTKSEPDEAFFVNVTNVVGATAGDLQGKGTISNDDLIPAPKP